MILTYKIKQKILKRMYNKARDIYIVCCWAKWAVLPAKFYKLDKNNNPLIIDYTDHNGEFEEYMITPWHHATSGPCLGYFFNQSEARQIAYFLNKRNEK